MEIGSLGPDGVLKRIGELQSRMRELFPAQVRPAYPKAVAGISIQADGFEPLQPGFEGVRISPEHGELKPLIEKAASEAGVDAMLLDALVQAESAYDPLARSRAGAMGLTQLMPGTAAGLGVANPFDPLENLKGGAKYLSQMLSRFGGDLNLALAAYNAGPGAVQKHNGVPPYAETQAYVKKVLALYEARRSNP